MTKIVPTSWRTHSSKIVIRKSPYSSGKTVHGVTSFCGSSRSRAAGSARCRPCSNALLIRQPFDNRGELDEFDTFAFQKAIDIKGPFSRFPGNAGQHVVFNPVFLEQFQTPHDPGKCALALPVPPVAVMDLLGAVQADADHELMFFEEPAPLVGEQRAVGLEGIGDRLLSNKGLLQFHHPFEEVDAQQGRLPALPDELEQPAWAGR